MLLCGSSAEVGESLPDGKAHSGAELGGDFSGSPPGAPCQLPAVAVVGAGYGGVDCISTSPVEVAALIIEAVFRFPGADEARNKAGTGLEVLRTSGLH